MAIIGNCNLDMYLPGCHSLKEKRMVISSIKQKLRKDFNVAVSELHYNDYWQRALIGIVTISNSQGNINEVFDKIIYSLENNPSVEIVKQERNFY